MWVGLFSLSFNLNGDKGSPEIVRLTPIPQEGGGVGSLMNGGWVCVQSFPSPSAKCSGVSTPGWGGGALEEGRALPLAGNLTWKMTRTATTSTFFVGFPVGDKGGDVTAWRRQRSVIKESGGWGRGHRWELSSQAPCTTFAEREHQNQIVRLNTWPAAQHPCLHLPPFLLHSQVWERRGTASPSPPPTLARLGCCWFAESAVP